MFDKTHLDARDIKFRQYILTVKLNSVRTSPSSIKVAPDLGRDTNDTIRPNIKFLWFTWNENAHLFDVQNKRNFFAAKYDQHIASRCKQLEVCTFELHFVHFCSLFSRTFQKFQTWKRVSAGGGFRCTLISLIGD